MEDEFDIVYRQLFRKYYANLLFYATRMVGEEDAEDVVQEVFVELWHRKDSVTVGEQIQAFLYRAVYTRALNVLKHRDIKNSYEAAMQEVYNKRALFYQPDDNDVLKRIEDRELRKHIISAIDELPEKCKLVFKLSYIIRKSKFPQNPKRSVRFSGKRTKRSVQKRKARNTQKAETKVL